MSRRSQVTRNVSAVGPSTPRPIPQASGSSPAFGSLWGQADIAPDSGPYALQGWKWWQTPRLDPYVVVEPLEMGTAFVVLQPCDLLVNLHVDIDLPPDDTEPGY